MKSLLENKKGNVDLIMSGVMVLVFAGFLFVMGIIMLDELFYDTATTTTVVFNESFTTVTNDSSETVANATACGFNKFSIINMTWYLNQTAITSTNYEVDNAYLGTWSLSSTGAANASLNNTNLSISYQYDSANGAEVCSAANETLVGQGKFGDFFDLIVLAIIIVAIITLIIGVVGAREVK